MALGLCLSAPASARVSKAELQSISIPIDDSNGYFVANEINHYTINSFMLEAGEIAPKDGRLVIDIQKEKPSDPEQAKNWLPAPAEGFRFTSRYYGPYAPLTDGTDKMSKVIEAK